MKNIKYLLLIVAVVMLFPLMAFAEDVEDTRAKVYFFHGETCPHCQEARTWFESIQEEYGSKYVLVEYEVWNNEENAALMEKVSTMRNDNATGVPYIVCGDKSWIGFDEATMADEIKGQIDAVYASPVSERYDAVQEAGGVVPATEEKKPNDVVSLIIILVVAGLAGFGIYKARKTTN